MRGSFHHEAATYIFGLGLKLEECHSFSDVINSTKNGHSDYGVMAIENSIAGCIIPNYNLLRHSGLEVCGETGIRVRLNLMALNGEEIGKLTEVHSHQMALRQCGSFLGKLNGSRIVEAFDTAGSAKNIQENKLSGVAAIAGNQAAREYGLSILAEGIEDHKLNYTRFLILKRKDQEQISTCRNKMSVYFETAHSPGSLAKLLTSISQLNINLSKLQSHPVPSKNSHYGFFATLDISEENQIEDLQQILNTMTISHQILGVYEKGETHG